VIDRALAFDKSARWPDAETMRAALREAYQELHGVPLAAALPLEIRSSAPDWTHVRRRKALGPEAAERNTLAAEATGESDPPKGKWGAVRAVVGLTVAAGVTIGFALLASSSRAPATARHPAPTASAATATATVGIAGHPAPTVASLPALPEPATPTAAPATPHAAIVRAATPSGRRLNCDPPYREDPATGKKVWKLECL
jgi:hypothetical protein